TGFLRVGPGTLVFERIWSLFNFQRHRFHSCQPLTCWYITRSWRAASMMIINVILLVGIVVVLLLIPWILGVRYIPHHKVGIVEKFWSPKGSLTEGRIIAVDGEAGFQAELLRGGLHAGFFPWQYRIHKEPLVLISEGKVGYVYARDGSPLPPSQ